MLDIALECVRPAVEDQILRQLALLGGDVGVGGHVGRVDDGHVQPGLNAVIAA